MTMNHSVDFKALMASIVLAIIVSAGAAGNVRAQQADPAMVANLVLQVQELQDEVRTLRGMLEEQARELENLKRRQRDQYLDLDRRALRRRRPRGRRPPGQKMLLKSGPR